MITRRDRNRPTRASVARLAGEDGAVLIEFSLLLPFLLIIVFGIYAFGNALLHEHVLVTGVRDAARYLARTDVPANNVSEAQNLAVYGNIQGSGNPRIDGWQSSDVTVTFASISNPIDGGTGARRFNGPDPLTIIQVTTEFSYDDRGLLDFLGFGAITLDAKHEQRYIGV